MDGYTLIEQSPDVEDYLRLRVVSGLSPKTRAGAEAGLPNTWYGVHFIFDGRPVAMGRVIGDGGTAFQIVDMAVEPEHQGKGLGKVIMTALVARLQSHAPSGAYVSLVADGDAKHLYAKYGFEPVMPKSIGMAMVIRP
ncbi:GNAT family N-acetyltransferase [Devosia sp. BK]|uniref:GNAT family N-acetyltransferase n=1 Tax=Devosia sp. BK TaxID=2871706 RepID=UPI00293AFAB0|nr:GNAT family N-acetyltransferase [Devosia sp. BK]MDV3250535.1 GNAT family N-acetyltransferase [Devosia sp. BK]